MKNKERERYSGGQATVPSVCKSPQTLVNFDQTLRPFLPLPSLFPPSPPTLSFLLVHSQLQLLQLRSSLLLLPLLLHVTQTGRWVPSRNCPFITRYRHTLMFSAPILSDTLPVSGSAPQPTDTPTSTITEHLRPHNRW